MRAAGHDGRTAHPLQEEDPGVIAPPDYSKGIGVDGEQLTVVSEVARRPARRIKLHDPAGVGTLQGRRIRILSPVHSRLPEWHSKTLHTCKAIVLLDNDAPRED